MFDQVISRQKKEEGKTEGLTSEERRCLEDSIQRNESLMRRLAKL